jgi:hypothetical protein
MANWKYTAAERRTIDDAYSAVAYIVDHSDHSGPYALRQALRGERRERSSVTVAKALLVAGFADGRKRNPRALELAYLADGVAAAAILGAKSRRLSPAPGQYLAGLLRRFPKMAAAAAAAQDAYISRGLESSRLERAIS